MKQPTGVFSAATAALLLATGMSLTATAAIEIKRYTALTPAVALAQGEVTNTFHRLAIPPGPIAVYRFEADVVEQDAATGAVTATPSFDAYLHHHVVGSAHEHYASQQGSWSPMKPAAFSRSVGFGAGTECRGTPQAFVPPYAFTTVAGEDEWVANIHIINTRRMPSKQAGRCLECPCTAEDKLDGETVNGGHLRYDNCNAQLRAENNSVCAATTYHGGLRCCEDGEFCLEPEELASQDTTSSYHLRYTIEYADIGPETRALYVGGCCDASGDLEHTGNVEYDVPLCDPETHPGCVHTLATRQRLDGNGHSVFRFADDDSGPLEPADREVELVYAVGHQHRGGLGISLYDDATGDLLCASVPTYGEGDVAGDERGYVVAMSTCALDPPRRMRASDVVRVVALYNNTVAHTGAMSLMYLALSDVAPDTGAAAMTQHQSAAATSLTATQVGGIGAALLVAGALVAAAWTRFKMRAGYTPLSPATQ